MGKRVVIIGGSVAGLGAALGLAKRGFAVTVVEQDPPPATTDGDQAFESWDRRHVPQFRQPHAFSARSHRLLLEHAPEVVDLLAADGISTSNFFKELAPQELWEPSDDEFDGLMTRRPAFELALRRAAESSEAITFVCPARVSGLVVRDDVSPPTVRGVRLADGSTIEGDVVLDAGGRRTLVPGWLTAVGVEFPTETQDCESTYHTRYYRLRPGAGLPVFAVVAINAEITGAAQLLGFPGDHDTVGICIMSTPGDEDLAPLRENWGFDAALRVFPSAAGWVDPANSTPINDVATMAGNRNIRRHFVADGRPLVLGLLPVGDALCTTNPAYGWGASMALTYASAAVDAIDQHLGDFEAMALSYDAAVAPEADAVYRESAAADRYRLYRWRGEDVPADDAEHMDRQDLVELGIRYGSTRDPVLGRALLRRINLIERPDETFDDPEVLEHAEAMRQRWLAKATSAPGPTRADLLAAIAAADAQRTEAALQR